MDVILHVGAHRSGTTTFQQYMRSQKDTLDAHNIGFWGPARTRKSVFPGLLSQPSLAKDVKRASGRVQLHLGRSRTAGVKKLLVSDENMIGSSRQCLREGVLYPAIGDRMARISAAFGGQINRVILTIRAQDLWWASAAAFTVARGHAVPMPKQRDDIAQSARTWRDVITDLACAVPSADVLVTPFEQSAGNPHMLLNAATGGDAPSVANVPWLNRSSNARELRRRLVDQGADPSQIPDNTPRWQPFNPQHIAQLREKYADDLHWLVAGADGLATLREDPIRKRAGTSQPAGHMTRGHGHDSGQEQHIPKRGEHGQGHMAHIG
jgi:hypothetical protein